MSTPNGSVYQVVVSGEVQERLKNLHRKAKDKGQGARVLTAVKQIVARLRTDPLDFGEPRFSLRHLNLEVRVATMPPLLVVYGVHTERRTVFVRDFLALPGSDF
jgi:hypothetical protein